jgi:excisionase family DNA binding protein
MMPDAQLMLPHSKRLYRRRQKENVSQHLFDLDQAADWMGCSRRFVELEIARGKLAKIMLSRRMCRIAKSELERYAESQTINA